MPDDSQLTLDDVEALSLDGGGTSVTTDTSDLEDTSRTIDNHEVYSSRKTPADRADELDGDTSDDADPRRLTEDASADELRWYYRWEPFTSTIVDKPIDDAFKHGYEVRNDNNADLRGKLLDDWEPHRREARKKARRDGVAFVYVRFEDDNPASQPPRNVSGVQNFETLTIDDLTDAATPEMIADETAYDYRQLRVLEQGIVVVEDITSPDHHEIVGVLYEESPYEPIDDPSSASREADVSDVTNSSRIHFLHGDRLQHFVEGANVDGPLHTDWVGHVTGHPVIATIFHQLKALAKASWATGQTLYRYSAPLHAVEMPEDFDKLFQSDVDEHQEALNEELRNLNAASSVTLPPGHEMSSVEAGTDIDPEPFIEALIELVCAGSEFTKSVLMGTQSGTVSGSETDIKSYFNQVQRYRQTTATKKAHEIVDMVRLADGGERIIPNTAADFEISWGPLFKLDELDTTEAMVRVMTAVTNGVNSYLLTPEEARDLVAQEWAELGIDVDEETFDELTEADFDTFDRINMRTTGQRSPEDEPDTSGNPSVGNTNERGEGGMEQGQTTAANNPASDGTDEDCEATDGDAGTDDVV
jgi:hypothetical protein